MKRFRRKLLLTTCLGMVLATPAVFAQTNAGDYSVTYGVNYSSADRKQTVEPSTVVPGSFSYRPACNISLGLDDDSFVSNKTAASNSNGTGNLGLEGHWTFWRGFRDINGDCAAAKQDSLRLDYIATVPVHSTLESTEVAHQVKATYNHPAVASAGLVSDFLVNVGFNVSGVSTGGNTVNALATGNYYRNFHAGGVWGFEAEADLASRSRLGPSSTSTLIAFDGALDKAQAWGIRFGSSFGVTPYAPKVSPFLQLTYNGQFKVKK